MMVVTSNDGFRRPRRRVVEYHEVMDSKGNLQAHSVKLVMEPTRIWLGVTHPQRSSVK